MIDKLLKLSESPGLKPISGMDATFLYLESPTSPMHMGSISIIEGPVDFDKYRSIILSRIHMIPKFRKKLVYLPFSVNFPYWVDDADFNIDLHIHHIALPKPGDWKTLRKISSKILSDPLDQSRPLWSFTFIEGLNNIPNVSRGSTAIVSKMHHVAMDGTGGAGLLGLLFDFSSDPVKLKEPKPYHPEPVPNELKMMLKSSAGWVGKSFQFPKMITELLSSTFKAGFWTQGRRIDLPTAPFTAPDTPLNGTISSRREWDSISFEFQRLNAMKKKVDSTFNDIILAICSGALRKYLSSKDCLPKKSLIAMVPISIRKDGQTEDDGNQLSSMLIKLSTNQENPLKRLEQIIENSSREKTYQRAIGTKTLSNLAEIVPFGLANEAARLYSYFKVSEMHNPAFNVTITNVPGPQFPLYLDGHKLLSLMGTAPIVDGMGLMIAIFSYNGQVTISCTSDSNSMPDIDIFTDFISEAVEELEQAVYAHQPATVKKEKKKNKAPESDKLFAHFKKQLKLNAQHIKPNNGLFQMDVAGDQPRTWKIDLNQTPGNVRRVKPTDPDVVISVKEEHLLKIGRGDLSFQTAFIQGRLKIEGDYAKAIKLGTILSKLEKMKV